MGSGHHASGLSGDTSLAFTSRILLWTCSNARRIVARPCCLRLIHLRSPQRASENALCVRPCTTRTACGWRERQAMVQIAAGKLYLDHGVSRCALHAGWAGWPGTRAPVRITLFNALFVAWRVCGTCNRGAAQAWLLCVCDMAIGERAPHHLKEGQLHPSGAAQRAQNVSSR